ncbi:hypothetical protein [Helicobacter bilis]|uniref:hypothetical protein n=1 Tax=Helicobacter bilis TaxID=37372 RepID=UPI00051CFCCA|nr:hypothetical protein [Helicobacter bilis]TLE07359.1 hypothetical protein LS78_009625 [Helicobacter bilis]
MHYKPRPTPPKVQTDKFDIDFRLLDLLDITSKRYKISKNKIFEAALMTFLSDKDLPLKITRKRRKKFLVKQATLELLETKSYEFGLSKNAIVNKSLKEFLIRKPFCHIKREA